MRETERCFNCGLCNQCDNCHLFCPDMSVVHDPSAQGRHINYDYCKGCGLCVVECPRNAMTLEEENPMKRVLEGSQAVAEAVRLARVQVVSAYPITPQTHIVEILSDYCATGKMNAKFLRVESEHSCMAALIGAQSAGVRTFTATSGQGLALMHELLHWASGARLPIVMAEVNRALAPGWNIWVDQTDSLAQRDTGWIQFYCEDSQEVIDTTLQAYKLAESVASAGHGRPRCLLPLPHLRACRRARTGGGGPVPSALRGAFPARHQEPLHLRAPRAALPSTWRCATTWPPPWTRP